MAKFAGKVGYRETVENPPGSGVWEEVITEVKYFGDVVKDTRKMSDGTSIINDVSVQNSISIMADAYANEHFFAIVFVEWAGVCWTVPTVEVQRPRLLLRLGEVYNGERASVAAG